MKYPLAKQGVFRTIQGEGMLMGIPMTFVRLAGCSVGCSGCDTDYSVSEHCTAAEIGQRVRAVRGNATWTWVTGGEPADYDLWPLLEELRLCGRVALATSGSKHFGDAGRLIDFLSVSPHNDAKWVVRRGQQINLVPGLGGLSMDELFAANHPDNFRSPFGARFLTPLFGSPESLAECLKWLDKLPAGYWRLGCQAHHQWGLP